MAPKKLKDATLEDLERIFKKHGHKPQIALGLAVAARAIPSPSGFDVARAGFDARKIRFLGALLGEYDGSSLAGEIYAEVTNQLIDMSTPLFFTTSIVTEESTSDVLHHLIDFLGQHPTFEGMRGKVREFLSDVSNKRLVAQGSAWWARTSPALTTLSWVSLTHALLRYQMYAELGLFVENRIYRVYDAIPALFEAVVEQAVRSGLDPDKARLALGHLMVETDAITKRFFCRLDDHRALRLLLMLEGEYRKEYGKPYELPGDDKERRHSVAY